MEDFSKIDLSMREFEKDYEDSLFQKPVEPWPTSDSTTSKRLERIRLADDFWQFDKLYFTNDSYSGGYSKPCNFHKFLFTLFFKPGVNILLGPRKHAKTAYAKKIAAWLLLTGRENFIASSSETLPTSRNILRDIADIVCLNERILFDFKPSIIEKNADEFTFFIPGSKGYRHGMAFSEGRSVRGASRMFSRPGIVIIDDLETRQSSFGNQQTDARIRIIDESFQSLKDNGSALVLGNNFDERCALNKLKLLQSENLLQPYWRVYSVPAYLHKPVSIDGFKFTKGALWKSRFSGDEFEVRDQLMVYDESSWLGDFQQVPVPPDGEIFTRSHFKTFKKSDLPKDARGVVYCDPNLAKKSRGDSTCVVCLLYSPSEDKFYVTDGLCRSFSDSNKLLDAVLNIRFASNRVVALGFDGNVSQESSWTNNVRNWCRINGAVYPLIEYKKYKVDELAKNAQIIYNQDKIVFEESFSNSTDGDRFKQQLFSFAGKKSNRADDAPDALICSLEFISERGLARAGRITLNMPLLSTF